MPRKNNLTSFLRVSFGNVLPVSAYNTQFFRLLSMEHAVPCGWKDCPRLSCKGFALLVLIGRTKQQTIGEQRRLARIHHHYTQGAKQKYRHDGWTVECLDLEINICRRHISPIARLPCGASAGLVALPRVTSKPVSCNRRMEA